MNNRKRAVEPCEAPGTASVEGSLVVLDGPDGVAVTMTAEAARLTGSSLISAAARALGTQDVSGKPDDSPSPEKPSP
ncbi:MAG: hypothetical protein Q7T87_16170 [Polaromonas sp.]|nr:hypothetical protein [Polaromonas sp.]